MKRDMDLVRQILLICEATGPDERVPGVPEVEGYSRTQVGYHIYLMGQAGLLDTSDTHSSDDPYPQALLHSVTWRGHEFIDSTQSPTVWNATKELAKKAGGAGFELLLQIAKYEAKEQLKKLGVDLGS